MPYVSSTTIAARRAVRDRIAGEALHDADGGDITAATGRPYAQPIDWARLGVFGAGLALGALLGSGTALLFAPESGAEVRSRIRRRARRLRGDARDAWDGLRDELDWLAHRGRTRVRRGIVKGGWAAEDAIDKGRRKLGF